MVFEVFMGLSKCVSKGVQPLMVTENDELERLQCKKLVVLIFSTKLRYRTTGINTDQKSGLLSYLL